jgi:hypothetical protein
MIAKVFAGYAILSCVVFARSRKQGMDMTQKITGKWISSDCGDVKPRAYPK